MQIYYDELEDYIEESKTQNFNGFENIVQNGVF